MLRIGMAVFALIAAAAALPTAAQETAACRADAAFTAGVNISEIESAGRERRYTLYVPASYDPAVPTPLIISLHGFTSNSADQMKFSQWNAVADAENLLVVYPQGAGFPPGWNTGFEGTMGALFRRPDDVVFMRDLLDHLSAAWCIDPARIYANGFSNGAGMSSLLGCELADRIAAIGGVAGAYPPSETCQPGRAVPVIAFHGLVDPISPFEGGETPGGGLLPIAEWAAQWAARNGCGAAPIEEPVIGAVSRLVYSECDDDAAVILYLVADGGHTWPGGGEQPEELVGLVNRDINASELMWAFFAQHPLS